MSCAYKDPYPGTSQGKLTIEQTRACEVEWHQSRHGKYCVNTGIPSQMNPHKLIPKRFKTAVIP